MGTLPGLFSANSDPLLPKSQALHAGQHGSPTLYDQTRPPLRRYQHPNHPSCTYQKLPLLDSALRYYTSQEQVYAQLRQHLESFLRLLQRGMFWVSKHIEGETRNLFLSFLGFLKHHHSQVDLINSTLPMERVMANRNLLQSCSYSDVSAHFNPYLFNLTME